MHFYRIEYTGRNTMGANMRARHARIAPGMDERTAIDSLKRADWGRALPWPHAIWGIENIEPASEGEFEQQQAADELDAELRAKQSEWNKVLQS